MNGGTLKDKYLIFSIGAEEYGIEIKHVLEIIGMNTIRNIPGLPSFIKGVVNLKGNTIHVIDVRDRFKKEKEQCNCRTCVILISVKGESIGFIVDKVTKVIDIDEEQIVIPPEFKSIYKNRYIKGIYNDRNTSKMILDCERFINYECKTVDKAFKE